MFARIKYDPQSGQNQAKPAKSEQASSCYAETVFDLRHLARFSHRANSEEWRNQSLQRQLNHGPGYASYLFPFALCLFSCWPYLSVVCDLWYIFERKEDFNVASTENAEDTEKKAQ